jgi:hypothetical protein
VDLVNHFYRVADRASGTHLALCWKGMVRFIIPLETNGQQACWTAFRLGRLSVLLRIIASLPCFLGSVRCVEGKELALIRKAIGEDLGLSCCRIGTPGPWSKDTILILNKQTAKPLYIVKAGKGAAVESLIRNEACWLQALHDKAALADHIPELNAYHFGTDFSFVAQSLLSGQLEYQFREPHIAFLRKMQEYTRRTMPIEESRLYLNLHSRLKELSGFLTEAWAVRLKAGMKRIEQSLSGNPIILVAAHNDFTPWNIRVECGIARVFDWEYADVEQLPLFDALHFALMPMALKHRSMSSIFQKMQDTLQMCDQWFGHDLCYEAQTQALAYMLNLCVFFLLSTQGKYDSHPVLDSYADLIDHVCLL